jgi:hypothetical protein
MDEDTLQRSLRSRPPADPVYRPRLTNPRATIAPVGSTHPDRVPLHRPALRTRFLTMNAPLKIAAVAVLALAVGIGVVQLRPPTNNVGSDVSPSPSSSPLVWTSASIEQDWPAPVREEPVGDPVVIPFADGYLDPRGDIGSADMPWVDILRVDPCNNGACLDLGARVPSELMVPDDPWVAYGLVSDTDLDGVADVRLGMDRVPVELTPRERPSGETNDTNDTDVRAWRTDLRTGVTEYGEAGSLVADGGIPIEDPGDPATTGHPVVKLYPHRYPLPEGDDFVGLAMIPGRFYAWASVIQDGRVVATDYAPDTGWLDPTTVVPEPTDQPGVSPHP